jgi:hypothetical protein
MEIHYFFWRPQIPFAHPPNFLNHERSFTNSGVLELIYSNEPRTLIYSFFDLSYLYCIHQIFSQMSSKFNNKGSQPQIQIESITKSHNDG